MTQQDRITDLTVESILTATTCGEGCWYAKELVCRCSCGNGPRFVELYNFQSGRSTRCSECAKKKAVRTQQKRYWRYEDVCPDQQHRTRLLNRISAIISRCTNPKQRYCVHMLQPSKRIGKWRDELSKVGLRPIMTILLEVPDAEADEAEQDIIAIIRATREGHLLNSTMKKLRRFGNQYS